MSRYNTGPTATLDDTANALLLRANLHITLDKRRVAFAPRLVADGSMQLVAHLLECSHELEHLYHNRELHSTVVGVAEFYLGCEVLPGILGIRSLTRLVCRH
jgi:hypothetical protein